jgi:hypothetical protein
MKAPRQRVVCSRRRRSMVADGSQPALVLRVSKMSCAHRRQPLKIRRINWHDVHKMRESDMAIARKASPGYFPDVQGDP